MTKWVIISAWALASAAALAVPATTSLSLDPHVYSEARGDEPRQQMVGQVLQTWKSPTGAKNPWDVSLHFEAEMAGRRDLSFDLDRAWIETPLAGDKGPSLTWGRIHPWDVSGNPAATTPWSLLGSLQPQNRGVLLGYGFEGDNQYSPSPVELGWVGAHFWSDRSHEDTFQWGASVSPIYLPPSGSEVSLFNDRPLSVGRFARRPPTDVQIGDAQLPLRYELDRSRLWQDVVLRPQAMVQATVKPSDTFQTWLTVQRAPSPDPDLTTDGYVTAGDPVQAVAQVKPSFPEQWSASVTSRLIASPLPLRPNLWGSLAFFDNRHWGYEIGIGNPILSLSYLTTIGSFATSDYGGASYADSLLQAELRAPLGSVWVYSGVKRHLTQRDLWWRVGSRYFFEKGLSVDAGADLFSGDEGSYFGEWRTNDRLYMVLTWEIGA